MDYLSSCSLPHKFRTISRFGVNGQLALGVMSVDNGAAQSFFTLAISPRLPTTHQTEDTAW